MVKRIKRNIFFEEKPKLHLCLYYFSFFWGGGGSDNFYRGVFYLFSAVEANTSVPGEQCRVPVYFCVCVCVGGGGGSGICFVPC